MKTGRVAAIALLLVLAACSKVTQENYDRLAVGMDYDQVTALLGAPSGCDDVMGVRSCVWGDDERSVSVNFVAGKVLIFSSQNLK